MPLPVPIFPYLDLDALIEALSPEWLARRELPEPAVVVVPSLPFSDYLQLKIAKRFGVCMGFKFLMPQDLIHQAMGQRESAWMKRNLLWQILPHVTDHAGHLGLTNPSPRDCFAVAGLLADRLDQYGHFRPEMIQKWSMNTPAIPVSSSAEQRENEVWQRELWRQLAQEIGTMHPAMILNSLKDNPAFREQLRHTFPKLLVLGTGALDPLLMEMLALLCEAGSDVKVHVVLPSLNYLGDLKRRNELPLEDANPEAMEVAGVHPLFESMGRHAVGAFLLLGKLDDQYTHWPEPGETRHSGSHLLNRLQSDLRNLTPPIAQKVDPEDVSLRVHSCFGARREMEVVRDELLRAFQDLEGLTPEQIHIVTPSIEIYAPLVSAVLEQSGILLPVRLTELPPASGDPVKEGIQTLLEMAREAKFEASWLMALLHLRAVQNALGIPEDEMRLERVRGWVRQSGLTQGLEPDEPGSWTFARDRLIAGRWLGNEAAGKYGNGDYLLPVADELGGDPELRDQFLRWFYHLELTLQEWQIPAPAAAWAQRLGEAGERLFAGVDEARLAIQKLLVFLESQTCPEALDVGSIGDWFLAESQDSGRRTAVSGRIVLGRFKQLQNIPCRVLVMIGMQDGKFPGQNRVPAWDLLQFAPRVWDRNPRVDDRQLFLDGILTPRDRLIITASSRNVRTKKDEPFSSCVDELLRVATLMGARREKLVIEHRLQPFAQEYFTNGGDLPPSFDQKHARIAESIRSGRQNKPMPFWSGENIPADSAERPREISIASLVTFWVDPAKAYLRAQRVAVGNDEGVNDEALDRTPMALNHLETWSLKNSIVQELAFGGGDLAWTEAQLRANRELPAGALGLNAWQRGKRIAEPLGERIRAVDAKKQSVDFLVPNARVRLTGELSVAGNSPALFYYRSGEMKRPKHFVEPWIQAVIAAASGYSWPMQILDEVSSDEARHFPAIATEDAVLLLENLIAGYGEGQSRPLGFAAGTSVEYLNRLDKGSDSPSALREAANKMWFPALYGPRAEGDKPWTMLAWRDRDPFDELASWDYWAKLIAVPLREWGQFK